MLRCLTLGLVLACAAPVAAQPDEGTPRYPYAWIRNNTDSSVRVVVSSVYGPFSGPLGPGQWGRLPFRPGAIPRVLTVFDRKTGKILANREVVLKHDHVYDVEKFEEAEVEKGGKKYKMKRPATTKDEGSKRTEKPKGGGKLKDSEKE